MRWITFCFCLALIVTPSALAQPPAETCGAGDSLSGSDMMPQIIFSAASSDDFDMSGTSCNEQGPDNVTCFTPTSSCTVVAECSDASRSPEGLQVSISVFQGSCTTTPASCLDSSQGTGSSGQISVALTGGTNYCFVCETNFSLDLEISLSTAGDCGPLPVDLQTFEIE